MGEKTRREKSLLARGLHCTSGDAALEYALVAAAIVMALGFAVWVTGPEIRGRMLTIQAAVEGADPVITTSIDKTQRDRPRPMTKWSADDARTRGTVKD
ncbi:MAG: hypothetical protein KDJ16_01345 [Hyphomicrobiales bacterium]|nr:hypothetical protein [Hyphomicrobiales bacterium]